MSRFNIKTIIPKESTQCIIILVAIIYHLTLRDLTEFRNLRYFFDVNLSQLLIQLYYRSKCYILFILLLQDFFSLAIILLILLPYR